MVRWEGGSPTSDSVLLSIDTYADRRRDYFTYVGSLEVRDATGFKSPLFVQSLRLAPQNVRTAAGFSPKD